MFIPIWVILVVVLALVVVPVFMVFSIRRNTNELIKKLDDRFEKMSLELRSYVGRGNLEPKSINSPKFSYETFSMSFLGYVRDINACIVFLTFTISAILFFSLKKNWLEDNTVSFIILSISVVIAFLPSIILLFKLIYNMQEFKGWKLVLAFIMLFIVTFIIQMLWHFSLIKLIPDVFNALKNNGVIN